MTRKCSKEPHRNRFSSLLIFLVDCSWWVTLLRPCWRDLSETVSLDYSQSHFALQVCSSKLVVLSFPVCVRFSVFQYRIVDIISCFSQRWVFLLARTVLRLVLIWSTSNWKFVSSIYWTKIWIFPPHNLFYYLGSCYAPLYWFWRNICDCIVHWSVFVCQTYVVILLELSLFETVKESFSGDCTVGCCCFCSIIHPLYCCMSLLLLMILAWITTMH